MFCSKSLLLAALVLVTVSNQSSTDHRDVLLTFTTINCSLALLTNGSDYTILNNVTLHYYTGINASLSIVGYSIEGFPLVCLPLPLQKHSVLNRGLSPPTQHLYQSLTIFLLCFSLTILVIAVACFVSTRTVFSLVTMNLALSQTMGDSALTLNAFGHDRDSVCTFSAIAEQFSLVAQLSLLAVLATNFALRLHRTANSLNPSYPPAFFKLLYLCVGWGPSFLITGVTMVIQALSRAQYGGNGFCHLAPPPTTVLLLVAPLIIGWIVATTASLYILWYLHKLQFSFDRTDKKQFGMMFALLVAMAVVITVTTWMLLDTSPRTHAISLFACIFATAARSILLLIGFMPKEQIMLQMMSYLTRHKRHVHPTPSPSHSAPSPSVPLSHDTVRQTIATLYPLETAELVKVMSDPSQVPKIYTCTRCYSLTDKEIT